MVVVTNRIPVAKGHEIDFEDRFKRRVHLVDRHPGFIRNEVHRPRPMKLDHEHGTWSDDPDGVTKGNIFEYNAIFGDKTRGGIVTRGADDGNGPVLGTVFRNNSVRLGNADSEGFVCYGGCTNQTLTLTQNVIQAAKKVGYADTGWTATPRSAQPASSSGLRNFASLVPFSRTTVATSGTSSGRR